ncbi:MAG: hypothetical protein FD171_376 [Actinobacteria bacterium]|nr:MAG: hypothetical protein FD171_376 [Actinomycetota bacterium]
MCSAAEVEIVVTNRNWLRGTVRITALSLALLFAAALPAFAAVPSVPTITDAYVSGVGQVTVKWNLSTDSSGHAVYYDIYRDVVPITSATILSRSLTPITSNYAGTPSLPVSAETSEVAQSYTWFYAVVAVDQPGLLHSAPSGNMAPNMHGYRTDPAIISCARCHQVHGAYQADYHTNDLCYTCHGSTNAATATGAKSTYNTQKDFADYSGQTFGSRHRNQYMTDNKTECTACHTAHRSSYMYDSSGTYQAASSYRMMLRVKYGTNVYAYASKNSSPTPDNGFCLSCHGSTVTVDGKSVVAATTMGLAGGPSAFANTGGDHNTANYKASAHGGSTIYSNDYPATNPGVQCEVCHDNHGSATTHLIDYRGSRTTDANANKEAELCYKCHSAGTSETKVAAGFTKPFSWNGRDVKLEFTTRGSHHPTAITSGVWVPTLGTPWSQTTQAEFNTDTLTSVVTTNTAGGEIVLGQETLVVTPPTRPMLYASQGAATTFSKYDTAGTAWVAAAVNPRFSPATGSSSFYVNGKVYVTAGGNAGTTNMQAWHDVSTNTWSTLLQATNLPATIGAGGDSTVNTRTAGTCAYYTRGAGTAPIMWWDYSGTLTGQFDFQTATNTARNLGVGSAIAYAPGADRLFVIYQNGTAGDGRIYYRSAPDRSIIGSDFAQGPLTTSDLQSRYARMTYFSKGGTEYLFVIGRDTGDVSDGIVISTLGGAIAKTDTNVDPLNGTTLGDGGALAWDGGDYLYAFAGGSSTIFRRALIPANPVAGPWTWTSLTASFAQAAGSSIAINPAWQPPNTSSLVYSASGTAVSTEILPYAGANKWGTLTLTKTEPATTDLRVTVEGFNTLTSLWEVLVSQSDLTTIDLSSRTVLAYSKLRLTADLTRTTNNLLTPMLSDWSVTSTYDVYTTSQGSLTCASCHNVHYNKADKANGVWDMDRASDPDNTKLVVTSTVYGSAASDFCMRCHDGAAATATTTAGVVVPYSAAFGTVTAPYFPGWNKEGGTNLKFSESGHKTELLANGQALCETCHDPHASDNARLGAWTRPAGVTWMTTLNAVGGPSIAGSRVNTGTVAREENLCYKCHGDGSATYPRSAGALNVYTKANLTYSHDPDKYLGAHTDTETAALLGTPNRHAECTDCHDPHVAKKVGGTTALALHNGTSSLAGGAVYGAWGTSITYAVSNWGLPTAYTPARIAGGANDFEANLCFKCHSGNTTIPATQTNIAQEFNPSNFSYHNVLGQSVGVKSSFTYTASNGTAYTDTWTPPAASAFLKTTPVNWGLNSKMTCTDCHTNAQNPTTQASGPHGSSVQWLLDPNYTNWTATTSLTNYSTVICGKCHQNLATSNNVHSEHDTRGAEGGYCRYCHIKTPHGWKRPRMLGYTTDPAPYATIANGTSKIRANKNYTTSNWGKGAAGDCSAGCTTGTHPSTLNGSVYWP